MISPCFFQYFAFQTCGDRYVEAATLKELSSHPTIEYIRHLEEESRRVGDSLAEERKKTSDMRVALNSAHRALAVAGVADVAGAVPAQPRASMSMSRPSSSHPPVRPPSSRPVSGVSTTTRPALPISVGTLAGANLAAGNSAKESMHVAFGATSKAPSVASGGSGGGGVPGSRPGSSRPRSRNDVTAAAVSINAYATGVAGGSGYGGAGTPGHARRNSVGNVSVAQTRPLSVGEGGALMLCILFFFMSIICLERLKFWTSSFVAIASTFRGVITRLDTGAGTAWGAPWGEAWAVGMERRDPTVRGAALMSGATVYRPSRRRFLLSTTKTACEKRR